MGSLQETLRALPSVEEVLKCLQADGTVTDIPHALQADLVRKEIEQRRQSILAGEETCPLLASITEALRKTLRSQTHPSLRRVINTTGVIIHTNLGRSVLAPQAIDAVIDAAKGYSTLEYDAQAMERGSRHDHYEQLICILTGAEAAIAVNNNAAAVMMVLHEFARDQEVVISRGELIEIGGSFRIPDIMNFSHAHMVEVGTTNKTHLSDFERAITDNTSMLLKVHTSNYRLIGFTESVEAKDLKKLADQVNEARSRTGNDRPLMVYEDLGSGLLLKPESVAGCSEPTVAEALAQGCDIVSFSGDKLLGGPQAGIIVGSKEAIDRLKKNPLARALRLDKMTIAALEATLRLYLDPEKARTSIPTLHMLDASPDHIRSRAEELCARLNAAVFPQACTFTVTEEIACAGGGSLPMLDIPSYGVKASFTEGSAQECMNYLVQERPVPIVGRIAHDALIFDARTLTSNDELDEVVDAITSYVTTASEKAYS